MQGSSMEEMQKWISYIVMRETAVKIWEVVVIKGNERSKEQWNLGIITKVYLGRDGDVSSQAESWKIVLEQAIQQLYSLELLCDITAPAQEHRVNAEAEEFQPQRNTVKLHEEGSKIWQTMIEKDPQWVIFNDQWLNTGCVLNTWQWRFNVLGLDLINNKRRSRSKKINNQKWANVKFINTCLVYK